MNERLLLGVCLGAWLFLTAAAEPAPAATDPDLARELRRVEPLVGPAAEAQLLAVARQKLESVDQLTAALADPALEIRRGACRVLGRTGPLAGIALPDLARAAHDPEIEVRLAALEAMGRLGRWFPTTAVGHLMTVGPEAGWREREAVFQALAATGVEALRAEGLLVASLQAPEGRVAAYAAQVLERAGRVPPPAVPPLIALLDRGGSAQQAAVQALAMAGETALPALAEALLSETPERRQGAAMAARQALDRDGVVPPIELVAALGGALLDPQVSVQAAAARALAHCGELPQPALDGLLQLGGRQDLPAELLAGAAESLGPAIPRSAQARQTMKNLAQHDSAPVAVAALRALVVHGADDYLSSVLPKAITHADPLVRLEAARGAARLDQTELAGPIAAGLMTSAEGRGASHARAEVVRRAAHWVGMPVAAGTVLAGCGRFGISLLQEALGDPRPEVRLLAAYGLGLAGEQALPAVANLADLALRRNEDPAVLHWAGDTLVGLGEAAVPEAARVAGARGENRCWAIELLGRLPVQPAGAQALVEALKDHDPALRAAACRALARLPRGGSPNLVVPLQDRSSAVRLAALEALATRGQPDQDELAAVLELAGGGPAEVRAVALRTLVALDGRAEHDDWIPVFEKAAGEGDAACSTAAWAGLGRLAGKDLEARQTLRRGLRAGSAAERKAAADGLGLMGPAARDAESDLMLLLWDQDLEVRKAAAGALARLEPTSEEAPLCLAAIVAEDEESSARVAAAAALAALPRGPVVEAALIQAVSSDPSPEVRRAAARALGRSQPAGGGEFRTGDLVAALQWVDPLTQPFVRVLDEYLQLVAVP